MPAPAQVLEDPRSFGDLTLGEPQGLAVDYKAIKRQAMAEYQERRDRIQESLHPETFSILDPMMKHDRILIDTRCWTYVLYDMLYAFDRSGRDPEVVAGLRPLFFSRVASFIRDTIDLTSPESEAMIVNQAKEFRRSRDYLLEKYDGASG